MQAIILNGFHIGHVLHLAKYSPSIKLLKPICKTIDYCCREDEIDYSPMEYIEYFECFRSIDKKIILYSTTGKSIDFHELFKFYSEYQSKPWTSKTILKFGYHGEQKRIN